MSWSWLQSCEGSTLGATSVAATFSTANLTAGTKLIAVVQSDATTGTCTGISDASSNAFVKVADSGNAATGFGGVQIWVLDTPAGDAGTKPTITASFNASTSTELIVQEVSGLLAGTSGIIDGTAGTSNGQTAGASGITTGTPTYVSSVSGEYLISTLGQNNNAGATPTLTGPAGYTVDPKSGAAAKSEVGIAYKSSTGGTETDGWTITASGGTFQGWGLILAAFKLSGSSPAVPVPVLMTARTEVISRNTGRMIRR